jgi:chaperonin cofactor prefoldin
MTDTKQLEMRMHKLDQKIERLASDFENIRSDVKELKQELGKTSAVLKNLCERLMVQG